ncbi:gamma-glutamyltransferase family protein [Auraticoccus sp. F435]|uniref:Gamma-glutamyltransferase family protein n=1 Tax=Auraticoccus cholistanensis TaxID=2656650 RepID=A0A6A9UQJ0_9ACTN|nr:gamma-glutamyltransferase [Auraticoccus cholistanensis]MVA75003.1 gamma-glutamyltransferase family protein [Auraticoccus cholistanensis]
MAFTTRPTLQGTFGMVGSTHWLASATAMSVLERGGRAADAAVAAAFVLHVVEPHLNGPAGEVPLIISVEGGEPQVLCGQGVAPAGATAGRYRELGLDIVPGTGPLAAPVPGAVDAWLLLLRDHGTWTLRDVLEHAIGLAEHGHSPVPQVAATVASVRDLFAEHWTSSAELYLGADGPTPGRLFRNRDLARTWQRLVAEAEAAGPDRETQIEAARRTWREGFVAEALVAAAATETQDSSGTPHAGYLSGDDLAGWEATWEQPVTFQLGDWTVAKAGAWSQGPVMLQQLALLGDVDLAGLDVDDPATLHRLVEGTKLAMADRDAWYGDAAPVDLDALLSTGYAEQRRALISEHASTEWRPGAPSGQQARVAEHIRRVVAGEVSRELAGGVGEPTTQHSDGPDPVAPPVDADGTTRGDTCHLDVVDRWGTMISATPSGGWLQSNPVVPGLGFPLGNRLQMAWLDDGLPNTLTPGRRPRTTLTPSLASYQGRPTIAFGTPGGDQQDQWSTHLLLRLLAGFARDRSLDLQGAIDAPNWHTNHLVNSFYPRGYEPASLVLESRVPEATVAELRRRGHQVAVGGAWSEGRLSAVARHPDTGILLAAANPRGMQGYAAGR